MENENSGPDYLLSKDIQGENPKLLRMWPPLVMRLSLFLSVVDKLQHLPEHDRVFAVELQHFLLSHH